MHKVNIILKKKDEDECRICNLTLREGAMIIRFNLDPDLMSFCSEECADEWERRVSMPIVPIEDHWT